LFDVARCAPVVRGWGLGDGYPVLGKRRQPEPTEKEKESKRCFHSGDGRRQRPR